MNRRPLGCHRDRRSRTDSAAIGIQKPRMHKERTKMKAVRLHGYGDPDQLVYEEAPDPVPGPGEVLVRVKATSVNPFDWKVRSGAMQQVFQVQFPKILGSDIAGTVEALGPDTTGFQ